jgi:predicted GNAT family N-acyltransferase
VSSRRPDPENASRARACGEVELAWAASERDVRDALALRVRVFCGEQGVPRDVELDGLDDRALHLLAREPHGARAVGTLRLLADGPSARIGRVVVAGPWRRRGIASRMLGTALARARELGCASASLAAQVEARALYEPAGFCVRSEPFLEVGIEHVWMRRCL